MIHSSTRTRQDRVIVSAEATTDVDRLFSRDSVPGKVVALLMGHTKADTTLNVYTQVIDGSLRTAVDKVGSELLTIVHNPG